MVCLCPLLQGCVGILVLKQHTEVIKNPVISPHPNDFRPAYTREMALKDLATTREFEEIDRQIKEGHEKGVSDTAVAHAMADATNHVVWVVYTPVWLQTHWGSPNHIYRSSSGGDEIWTYHFGRIWEGVMPMLILSIPLELPVGRKTVSFTLHDGRVVSVSSTQPSDVGWGWPKGLD